MAKKKADEEEDHDGLEAGPIGSVTPTTLTLVNGGIDWIIQLALHKGGTSADLVAKLNTVNHTPAVTDVLGGSFVEPSGGSGYAAITLTGATWAGSTSAGLADYLYNSPTGITYTFTSGGFTVYGVYIQNSVPTLVMEALLDTPFAVPAGGGSITLQLEFQAKMCP